MKYVMCVPRGYGGLEIPIIFPDLILHNTFKHLNPISAGEVRLYGADGPLPEACCVENAIRVSVSGKSETLGLSPRPQDEAIIAKALMRHYN